MKPMKSQEEEFGTAEYDSTAIAAGKISPEGVNLILTSYEVKVGKFGEFLSIKAKTVEGSEEVVVMTSSTKLRKLIEARWTYIKDRPLNLSGHGDSYERNYLVRLI